ncbi:unnamed protein product [Musa textilis]
MPNRVRQHTEDELGLPAVPQSFYTQLKEYCSQNAFKKDKENPTVTSPSGPTAPPPPPPVEDGGKQTGPSRSPMIPQEIRQPGAEAVVAADQGYYSRRIQDHEAIITYGLSLRG